METSRQAKYNQKRRANGFRFDVQLTPDDGDAFVAAKDLIKRYNGQKPALLALLRGKE